MSQEVELKIEGMSCGGCVKSVTRILEKQAGVAQVEEVELGRARFQHDAAQQELSEILEALEKAKFSAAVR